MGGSSNGSALNYIPSVAVIKGVSNAFSGPKKLGDGGRFAVDPRTLKYEQEMLARQSGIASGAGPSIAQMQFNQNMDQNSHAAMALAASQRGASNPMLAFRQAQIGNQQAGLEGAQQAAILAEQERRQAEQMIAAQAAAQRGIALNAANANMQSDLAYRNQNMQLLAGVGGTAAKAFAGGA